MEQRQRSRNKVDDVKNDSWLDEQWEDFSGLEEEAEMITQRRYKTPARHQRKLQQA